MRKLMLLIRNTINKLEVVYPSGRSKFICINIRPKVMEILKILKKYYRIAVFTASVRAYADTILSYLDPKGEIFEARYYRDHCIKILNNHIKDLRLFTQPNSKNDKNWTFDELFLIDNASHCFGFHIANGIPMLPFTEDKDDNEMVHLYHYLKAIALKKSVNVEEFQHNDGIMDSLSKIKYSSRNSVRKRS